MAPSRVSPQDPAAALGFAVVSILGALGLLERWGLTADDVAMVIGAAMTLAASVRALGDARRPAAAAAPAPMPDEQREAQRRSFVFGNTSLANDTITRELVDEVGDRMSADPSAAIGASLARARGDAPTEDP